MNELLSSLSRATGIVATVLVVAALIWGFLFSARETGTRRRPAWWLDLHNWLGGLALAMTAAHIVTALLDTSAGIGLLETIVPGTGSTALTWGVLATYLIAAAVFTTWPRRLRDRQAWRVIHLGSVVGAGLALVHGYQLGTDARTTLFELLLVALVATGTYALGVRAFGALARALDVGS